MSYYNNWNILAKSIYTSDDVFRAAAEMVESNMREELCQDFRIGCCSAFDRLREGASMARVREEIGHGRYYEIVELIDNAKAKFTSLYYADGVRRTGDSVYWMGTRSNMGQHRRIAALLQAAKVK